MTSSLQKVKVSNSFNFMFDIEIKFNDSHSNDIGPTKLDAGPAQNNYEYLEFM